MILYMPLVREYLELQSEKEIKDAISKVGGVNCSGVFLHPTKVAVRVNSINGVNRRSVSVIPQNSILPDLLKRLQRGNSGKKGRRKMPVLLLSFSAF